ncbi:MAG: prephenate dehydratase [Atribacterota bacterium]
MDEKDDYHYKKSKRVALQGEIGSFSEMAALQYFGSSAEMLSCSSFNQVSEAVKESKADYAILPIENSQTGGINNVHDLLLSENLFAIGEVILKIEHCLIAHQETKPERIEKIYSHPQALAQCERYLMKNFSHCQIIPVYDTAGSVKQIKESRELKAAGIASRRAATYYEMNILENSVEDNPSNYTRFLVFYPEILTNKLNNKTSIIFAVVSVPGAIHKCLREFAIRDINLSRLESRPSRMKPWEYIFYMDFENGLQESITQEALKGLRNCTTFIKIIGTYQSHSSTLNSAQKHLRELSENK